MVWVTLILAIIQILAKLPDLAELFKRIFGSMKKLRPLQIAREAHKTLAACEKKLATLEGGAVQTAGCPLEAYAADLDARVEKGK